jgi:hypothetical protein
VLLSAIGGGSSAHGNAVSRVISVVWRFGSTRCVVAAMAGALCLPRPPRRLFGYYLHAARPG